METANGSLKRDISNGRGRACLQLVRKPWVRGVCVCGCERDGNGRRRREGRKERQR